MVGSAFSATLRNVNRRSQVKKIPLRKGSAKVAESNRKDCLLIFSVSIVLGGNSRVSLKETVEESHILKT